MMLGNRVARYQLCDGPVLIIIFAIAFMAALPGLECI